MLKTLTFTDERLKNSGIEVSYTKARQEISVGGWYDGRFGIEERSMPLKDFLEGLGITLADCRQALGG